MADGLTPEKIFALGTAFWGAKTLLSAVELGVFTELAKRPLDAEAFIGSGAVVPPGLRVGRKALVAAGVVLRKDLPAGDRALPGGPR